jgi:MFS family permease
MIILDTTVINVAFQTLRREYQASLTDSQWIISVYVLALGITTPLSGFLADRFGTKRIYIAGLVLFVLASLSCGLAPSLTVLIIARAIQGIGGGLAQPLGPRHSSIVPSPQRARHRLGIFWNCLGISTSTRAILGGWLVDQDLWRWIFFINIPIGIVGSILATNWLPKDAITDKKPKADYLGIIATSVGFWFGIVCYHPRWRQWLD